MLKYIAKRIFTLLPVLLIVSFIISAMIGLMPGDTARLIAGSDATAEDLEAVRIKYGLDKPFYEQYFIYIGKVLKGDLGTSTITGRPVIDEIGTRLPNTLKLSALSLIIALVFGILFGITSAIKKFTIVDNITMLLALIGVSMPSFYLALMLMLLLCVKVSIFPLINRGDFISMVLPAICLSFPVLANIARMVRSSMIEVMSQDYILNARAQGFSERKVVTQHAFKNSMVTLITVTAMQFGRLIGGAVVIEEVFAYPGLGQLLISAINSRDMAVLQSSILIMAFVFVSANLLADILYAFVNPQIKY